MLDEKDYCDLDTCVALDEVGCPIPKYATINIHTKEKEWKMWISLYDAQKWLRKKRGIHVVPELGIIYRDKNGLTHYYRVLVKDMDSGIIITLDNDRDDFESYEEALSKGIRKAAELLKDKDKQKSPKNS